MRNRNDAVVVFYSVFLSIARPIQPTILYLTSILRLKAKPSKFALDGDKVYWLTGNCMLTSSCFLHSSHSELSITKRKGAQTAWKFVRQDMVKNMCEFLFRRRAF